VEREIVINNILRNFRKFAEVFRQLITRALPLPLNARTAAASFHVDVPFMSLSIRFRAGGKISEHFLIIKVGSP
jgi:hypothetical protein